MSFRIEYQPPCLTFGAFHALDRECFPEEPVSREVFEGVVAHDFWAAYDGDSLVGYSYVVRKPDIAWLSRIGTATTYRNCGIGARLMEAAIEHCGRIGLPDIMLYVLNNNTSAIRLYERFGFRTVENAYQFVLKVIKLHGFGDVDSKAPVAAVPISEVPDSSWPVFPREWTNIADLHKPPSAHVLIFRDRVGHNRGFCRLSPSFPGCFPFFVDRPFENLWPTLQSLKAYLLPENEILKLTFSDDALADACREKGLDLNYRLLKMMRSGDTTNSISEITRELGDDHMG